MEILGAILSDIAALTGYVLLFAVVYKLFQIGTELSEIKQILANQSRAVPPLPAMAQALAPLADLRSSDDASDYAEKLLRAVNAESQTPVPVASPNFPVSSEPQ